MDFGGKKSCVLNSSGADPKMVHHVTPARDASLHREPQPSKVTGNRYDEKLREACEGPNQQPIVAIQVKSERHHP